MSKGKVEQIGTPREIYYHPNSRFVADFIGEANFLEARVRSASGEKAVIDVVGQELTVNNFAKAGPGDDAVLVIRPEGATLRSRGFWKALSPCPPLWDPISIIRSWWGTWRFRLRITIL